MLNIFNLIKINFGSFLNTFNFSSAPLRLKTLLFITLYCLLGFFIYRFANYMVLTFNSLGMPSLALSEFFAFGSIFILALSIFRIDIFNSKDYDLLSSLPISKRIIITSKLISIYIFNLLITALIMIPVYISYIKIINPNINFYTSAIISVFIIPIIPTALATFINSIITIISSNFKHKKLIQTFLMLVLIILSLYFSYIINTNTKLNIFDIKNSLFHFFNNLYPLTKCFLSAVVDNNKISWLIFIGLSFLFIIILVIFLSIFYNKVTNKIIAKVHQHFNYKHIPNNNYFTNLVKKDIKRVLYSPNYLLNCCFGLILLMLISILLLFIDVNNLKNISLTEDAIIKYLPLIFTFLILISSTTSSLISLEGKNFYILKMLPIKFSTIWQSKVLSNYILILVSSFISLIFFNFSMMLSLNKNIQIILIILSSGLFISLYGLVINLLFPNFNWKSEITVIKQSASSFITIFTSIILSIYYIFNDIILKNNYVYILCMVFLLLSIILIIILQVFGSKIFNKLNI